MSPADRSTGPRSTRAQPSDPAESAGEARLSSEARPDEVPSKTELPAEPGGLGERAGEAENGAPPLAEEFPPTLREVMLRPWWLGMLVFALLVAGVFAWLGQWQLARSIDTDPPPPGATEQLRPLADVAEPGWYLPEPLVGQRVSTSGWWIGDDFIVVSSRFNDGVEGYWVTGQLRLWETGEAFGVTEQPVSLAVAIAWAPTRAVADAAASELSTRVGASEPASPAEVTGRLIADEGPARPPAGAPATEMTRMSPAALLGMWHDIDGLDVYRSYLVADAGAAGLDPLPAGLTAIDSPAPDERSNINWLNIFYAAEWAIFAGFAFYMWYRLAKDAWEKELEELEERMEDATGPA